MDDLLTSNSMSTAPQTADDIKDTVANMDETDWTTMLMEMRILSA